MFSMHPDFRISEEAIMLENYGFNPLEVKPEDGFWSYELKSNIGETLMISFNCFERWVKIVANSITYEIEVSLLIEKAESLSVNYVTDKLTIIVEADYGSGELVLILSVLPQISVSMSVSEIRKQ